MFLHHPQGAYKFYQLKLWIIELRNYNIAVCRYGKIKSWLIDELQYYIYFIKLIIHNFNWQNLKYVGVLLIDFPSYSYSSPF